MSGFDLFKASIERVFRHLPEALAISGVIWIGVLIAQLLLLDGIEQDFESALSQGTLPTGAVMTMFLVNLISMVGSCWVAVGWHRYSLLGERPTSAVPRFMASEVLAYLGWTIVLAVLLMVVVSFAGSFLIALVGGGAIGIFVLVGIGLASFYAFLRLSPILAGVAIGNKPSFSQAWQQTESLAGAIFQVAIINVLAVVIVMAPSSILPVGVISTLYQLVAGWLILMAGVSQISLIYDRSE